MNPLRWEAWCVRNHIKKWATVNAWLFGLGWLWFKGRR